MLWNHLESSPPAGCMQPTQGATTGTALRPGCRRQVPPPPQRQGLGSTGCRAALLRRSSAMELPNHLRNRNRVWAELGAVAEGARAQQAAAPCLTRAGCALQAFIPGHSFLSSRSEGNEHARCAGGPRARSPSLRLLRPAFERAAELVSHDGHLGCCHTARDGAAGGRRPAAAGCCAAKRQRERPCTPAPAPAAAPPLPK